MTGRRPIPSRLARILFWIALLVTLVVATMPQPVQVDTSDKVQHALAFAFLTILGLFGFRRASLWKLVIGLAAFGLLIEILQGTPMIGRDADPLDWLADAAGIAAALLLGRIVRSFVGRRD